jgi:HlyD family secretion protein
MGWNTARAQDATAPESIAALGRLEPYHGIIRVASPSTPQATYGAVLAELHVDEGDRVEKGQLLAVSDTAAVMQAMVEEGEASLAHTIKEVEAARSQATAACVRADVAGREAERRTSLHEQGLAGEEEADSARGEAEARQASCASARASVELAEAGVLVAEARLARLAADLERAYIRAPVSGQVLDILVRPGELMGEGGVLELGQVDRMYAIAEVYETDIRYVREGMRATVSSPALSESLQGTVAFIRRKVQKKDEIGTDPAARKDARIVEAAILLDDAEPVAGLSNLQVDILIHQ